MNSSYQKSSGFLRLFFSPFSLIILGALLFVSAYLYIPLSTQYFAKKEPFFGSPVTPQAHSVKLRNDSYGKGHFGASRNGGRTHKGLDISAALKEPLYASKSGRVSLARIDKGYGLIVEIRHPDGSNTRYAHLSKIDVREGEWVSKGTIIGRCGKTGNAKSARILPHVHYEVRFYNEAVDPSGLMDPSISIINPGK